MAYTQIPEFPAGYIFTEDDWKTYIVDNLKFISDNVSVGSISSAPANHVLVGSGSGITSLAITNEGIMIRRGNTLRNLPIGSNGQYLRVSGGRLGYGAGPSSSQLVAEDDLRKIGLLS